MMMRNEEVGSRAENGDNSEWLCTVGQGRGKQSKWGKDGAQGMRTKVMESVDWNQK